MSLFFPHPHPVAPQYPEPGFRIREEGGKPFIFDALRRRWLRLTPEEWVRQNLVRYLVEVIGYPAASISTEKQLMLGDRQGRYDLLVYDRSLRPWMLIECKAMDRPLGGKAGWQALRYGLYQPAPYLVLSNGKWCMVYRREQGTLVPCPEFPPFGA